MLDIPGKKDNQSGGVSRVLTFSFGSTLLVLVLYLNWCIPCGVGYCMDLVPFY